MKKPQVLRYFQFALIVIAAGSIYPLIYLKTNYQETILQVFNMSLGELNTMYAVLGFLFVVGYFPSGLLSDRFSSKKLLTISLFGTSLGGFWFAQIPGMGGVVVIFCIWGIFSVFTFWSAHMKLVKLLANKEEEGRFFGILDGGRGVVEALLASLALFMFTIILSGGGAAGESLEEKRAALVAVIYMYSTTLFLVALLVAVFLQDDKAKKAPLGVDASSASSESFDKTAKTPFQLKDISLMVKNKFVFLLGGIICMSYAVFWTMYYLGGFMETNIQVDPVIVAQIMVIVLWMRPIGGVLGGFLADKIGKTIVLNTALFGGGLTLAIMALLPNTVEPGVFYALVIACGICLYAIRGTYWSLLGDCNISNKILGASIGFISVLGYLPDMFIPFLNTKLFLSFGDQGGYNAYFLLSSGFALVGILLAIWFSRTVKKDAQKASAFVQNKDDLDLEQVSV